MKRVPSRRVAALLALSCALLPRPAAATGVQDESSAAAVLLSRAKTQEQRGRLDLAKQDWAQVLSFDPNDAQALAGMVRAARAEGRAADAASYLAKLKAAHPRAPELAQLERNSAGAPETGKDLAEADRQLRTGDARGALALYRKVYGATPPAGAPAVLYYQAQAGTEERPQAIAGLRALVDRYPADTRYALALGRILLASPRTKAEGRTLLERYPSDAEAVAALKEAGERPGAAGQTSAVVRALPKPSPSTPMSAVARTGEGGTQTASIPDQAVHGLAGATPAMQRFRTVSATGGPGRHQAYTAQEQAGFSALNQHRPADAERIFGEILAKDAGDPRALAGMGYVRVMSGDLRSAVHLFEQAQESGDHSLALTRALVNTQFDLALQTAATARRRGDLPEAEREYQAALRERPSDAEALQGQGGLLLQTGRVEEAIPVFTKLTQVRPMDPAAWRGLVIAQASAGQAAGALAADARVPADARAPLQGDASYEQALNTARSATGTQVARAEQPAVPVAAAKTAQPSAPGAASSSRPVQTVPTPAVTTQPNKTVSQASGTTPVATPPRVTQGTSAPATASPGTTPASAGAAGTTGQEATAPRSAAAPTAAVPGSVEASKQPSVAPPLLAPPTPRAVPPQATMAQAAAGSKTPTQKPGGARTRTARQNPGGSAVAKVVPPSAPATVPATPSGTQPVVPPTGRMLETDRITEGEGALRGGDDARAADLFRDAIGHEPERAEAWKGLVLALHDSGHNGEAYAASEQIPASAHVVLDRDATFQAMLGEVYVAEQRPSEAVHALATAQAVYAAQRLPPPLGLALRLASLLAARDDGSNLYRELVYLGERQDLTDAQRRDVQMIWTGWAVRRARVLANAGEQRRAVTVLNAVAESFPGNPQVFSAVAQGYVGIGLPREAVALYKAHDLSQAPAVELEAAVRAGSAARDFKAAREWARTGRERFPADPVMLTTIAEMEQARGHEQRAVDLSRQAKALAAPQNPGEVLTAELREAGAGHGWRTQPVGQLSVLLEPEGVTGANASGRPYLPSDEATKTTGGQQRGAVPELTGLGSGR